MRLYRARPGDGPAWVTGASSGVGRAVALDLARRGYVVAASARSADMLAELVSEAEGLSGRIVSMPCDVTDEAAAAATLARIESELGPVSLAFLNAGRFLPARGERLDIENFRLTYELNLFGVINCLAPIAARMKARQRGHIVIMGSASAYGGVPLASAYGSTKAALNNIAESLKFDFDRLNIRIQIINPAFIDTPLTEPGRSRLPALMPAGQAARRIVDGIEKGGFEVTMPRRLIWPLKLVNLLPYRLYFYLIGRATGMNKRRRKP
ncbi:SDR family NAD(P)-dependent oxidoreductase [Mesorhizobium xinjiangense]|uniref:SDR family NAD(P)-dependent oxidoreductase n=1 Tax=Mesorhizobium xinjiangense TaxID=2678685 RepID=UPI0012ED50B3|nr:SDR family NAD(P)-dependent oxidoreductase [Mesorhizobium xinjiangense]